MDAKLKPCPFCGGKAYIDVFMNHEYVACNHRKNCLLEPDFSIDFNSWSIRKQINAWNRRKDGEADG